MASENLRVAIYACVKVDIDAGKRPQEYLTTLTEAEHGNLVALERNIQLTNAFLFKGVKEAAAVGGEDEVDLYALNASPKKNKAL